MVVAACQMFLAGAAAKFVATSCAILELYLSSDFFYIC